MRCGPSFLRLGRVRYLETVSAVSFRVLLGRNSKITVGEGEIGGHNVHGRGRRGERMVGREGARWVLLTY